MDSSEHIRQQVTQACKDRTALNICGGNSKHFLGEPTDKTATMLSLAGHSGVTSCEPSELVITAKAGTTLTELQTTLTEQKQMLPFEPPAFGDNATIGGTIACSLSGPARPYIGAARDFVLGCTIINGKGQLLSFGGQVMKNVAGYDVTRLMTGAMGTLGVLLDVSMKVLPVAESRQTLVQETDVNNAIDVMQSLAGKSLPVTASAYDDGKLYYRLEGSPTAVQAAAAQIGGDALGNNASGDKDFWLSLREHRLSFFDQSAEPAKPLWRLSLPPLTPDLAPQLNNESMLYDWAGTQRWMYSDADASAIRSIAASAGGHAQRFRSAGTEQQSASANHPPANAIMTLHRNLKREFDPAGILNPGRLYPDL